MPGSPFMQLFLSPDFNIKTLRRKPKSSLQKAREWQQKLLNHQLTNLGNTLSRYIPKSLFDQSNTSQKKRRRIYTDENTFWGFFLQTLQSDSSCQSVLFYPPVSLLEIWSLIFYKGTKEAYFCYKIKVYFSEIYLYILKHMSEKLSNFKVKWHEAWNPHLNVLLKYSHALFPWTF